MRSRIRVRSLARPVYSAAAIPAGPAPMMTTSHSDVAVPFSILTWLRQEYSPRPERAGGLTRADGRGGGLRGGLAARIRRDGRDGRRSGRAAHHRVAGG